LEPALGDNSPVIRNLLATVWPPAAAKLAVPQSLPGAPGAVLTFDDGPHPEGTPAVLDVLARAGACATFFVVGEQVVRRPELLREMVAAGHRVELHGFRHRWQMRLPASAVRDDLRRGAAAVEDALGASPEWHRPPYGMYSTAGLRAVREMGLRPLLWSRWGKDWRRSATPEGIAALATREVADGDVILLHDADFYSSRNSHRRTVAALELIVSNLQQRKIATVLPV
jgi:peptidoglycan-N-acetylglucosamine deacetylase